MTGPLDEVLAHYRSLVGRWDEPLRTSGCAIWVRGRDHYRVGEVVHLTRGAPSRVRLTTLVRHNTADPADPLAGLVPTLGGAVVLEPVGQDVAQLADRLSLGGVAVSVEWEAQTGVRVTAAVDGELTERYAVAGPVHPSAGAGQLAAAVTAALEAADSPEVAGADVATDLTTNLASALAADLATGLATAEALTGIRLPQPSPFTLLRAVRLRAPR